MENNDNKGSFKKDDIYSKIIPAGKRKYFIDVKSTRRNDLYLTLSESRKRWKDNGEFYYEKHKLFLYKEDFDKFSEGLQECIDKIRELKDSGEFQMEEKQDEGAYERYTSDNNQGEDKAEAPKAEKKEEKTSEEDSDKFTDLDFDDLGKEK